jgi:hypothetical protein
MASTSTKPLFRAMKAKKPNSASQAALMDLPDAHRPEADTGQPEAIRGLLALDGAAIRACGAVWEPACGAGDLVHPIRGAGLTCHASDLIDRGCPDSTTADFFACTGTPARAIITNPPYNLINARDGHGRWLRHSLALTGWDYIALLLSWDWPAARANGLGELLEANPFSYCYLMRWKLDFTGGGSPPQRNAWFVWRRGWAEVPMQMRFMDRCDNRQDSMIGTLEASGTAGRSAA